MAKKKTGRQFLESSDERLISEAFEHGISVVRKSCNSSNAAKIYDLEGVILKRRKAATLTYLERVRKRYGKSFPESVLERTWARQNCAMGHSVDGLDHLYHFTLAAAIWMLDALKRGNKLKDAFRYFTKDAQRLEAIRLPDVFDPCHDEAVIRGMVYLIQERDERDNLFQWYISPATATRKTPVDHGAFISDPTSMRNRDRFNAVMSMIHPALKERAIKRFEAKLWEFLDRFFYCSERYAKLEWSLQAETTRLLDECREFHSKIKRNEQAWKSSPQTPVVQVPQIIARPITPQLPSFNALVDFGSLSHDVQLESDYDKLDRMAKQGIRLQDEVDEAAGRLATVIHSAHMAPLMDRGELDESLDSDIVDCILGFEADDPYEVCFGYLCLIEGGSDLPWLYNAALAVLVAAVRKLPWNAFDGGPEHFNDESPGEDSDGCILPNPTATKDPEAEHKESLEPRDWTEKKAQLYKLNYSDKPLYYPEEPAKPNKSINLPQLMYGMTGIVMPRTVSDFDEVAEELVEAGMEPGLANGMELYLQLALDIQHPSKDWETFLQSSRFHHLNRLYGSKEETLPETEAVDVERLQGDLKNAKTEIDSLRQELYEARKEAEAKRAEADRILNEAADERQELVDLRELIYNQANEREHDENAASTSSEIEFPYMSQKRIVVFGGHDTWLKAIRPLLPDVVFINREQNPNVNMIRSADAVWIQANALSHKNYYKIINIVRQRHIPIRYFGYASARKCAEQLAEEDMKG